MKLKTLHFLDNIIIWAVITVIVLTCVDVTWSSNNSGRICKREQVIFKNPKDGVCGSVDVRSNVNNLRKLENCTVVEGSVHITLLEDFTATDFENYTFPLLTEITGHLMLFRVRGLRSLKRIFPNLAIIRGQDLFYNYALVAYENADMEEVGLINLRTIVRGGVRITKNKKMCYVDTIDWARIAIGADHSEHHFMDNKDERQCANFCPENCTTVDNTRTKRCWTSQHCQKNLNCRCQNRECMDNGTCCHSYCLGGCTGPSPTQCLGCKGVVFNNSCQPRCPPKTYMFSDYRCLLDKECLSLRNRTLSKNTKLLRASGNGEHNRCVVDDCPPGYTVAEEGKFKGLECVKCKDFCPKECNSSEVNSIQDAQKLKGCSKIIGPLLIQIMGGSSVAQEMEENLGEIREVTGYIAIRRSFALLTLYFLKKLEVIGGETLTHQGHSLVVMDNVNLQELFPEGQKIIVKKGRVAFHSNRRLCMYKILDFVDSLNLTEKPSIHDISRATNGDLKPCAEHHMNLTVSQTNHDSVVLLWEKDSQDFRQLLTYNIIYKEVPKDDNKINIYHGRDACSDDVWMNREQTPTDDDEYYQMGLLPNLKPFTKYAAYVQAFTLTSATHSSMTNIITFQTRPYYPSEPLDLQVAPTDDPTELHVKWKPPKHPNGVVTHYKLVYMKQDLNAETFDQRNYCSDPIQQPKNKSKGKVEEEEKKQNVTGGCCPCPKSKKEQEKEQDKRNLEVFFENHLQNNVYCRRFETLPKAIDISDISVEWKIMNQHGRKGKSPYNLNMTDMDRIVAYPYSANNSLNDKKAKQKYIIDQINIGTMDVYNLTETVIPNLEPFMEYVIELQACQDTNPDLGVMTKFCSNRAITVGWTKALWTKDLINETTITFERVTNKTGDVIIRWESPPKPNGLILMYNLKYKRAAQDNLVPTQVCINIQKYKKYFGYRLSGLEPGNWTFHINAVSLAGNSSFTKERFFVIPQLPGESDKSEIFVVAAIIALLLLLLLIFLVVFVLVKHRYQNGDMTVVSQNMNYLPSSDLINTMDGWEVDRDKIRILQPLGQGSFGMVYKGLAKGIRDDPEEELWVAVKTVNDRANFFDRRDFLKEATTMKAFDCYHVVKLLGVVSTGQPALVIMELMSKDLKNYLREHRPDELEPGVSPPCIQDILQMAGEIADGMAYLADRKFVHRDLAARNCMVAEDSTVKIGDFGMARDIYETDYYRKGGKGMLPVRWMAPESLKDGVFTTMSDVWSYGVVLWEMVTLAAQPYQGLSNEEVVRFISDGNTMAVPEQCPEQMEYLMMRCWRPKQRDRPTFIDIIQYLEPYLNANFKEVSFYFSSGAHRFNGDGSGGGGGGGGGVGSPPKVGNSGAGSLGRDGATALLSGQPDYSYQSSPHSDENFCSNVMYRDPNNFQEKDVNSICHQQRNKGSYGDLREGEGSSELDESFEDVTDLIYSCDGDGGEGNDSRCFMGEEYQSVPSVVPASVSSSSSLREDPSNNSHHPSNHGLFELQPLISKESHSPSAASPDTLPSPNSKEQPSHPASVSQSDYIGFNPVQKGSDKNVNAPSYNSQLPHQNSEPVLLPLATPPPAEAERPSAQRSSPAGQGPSLWPSGSSPLASAPASGSSRPSLRLPVLNQPPGGSFRQSPLTTHFGDSRNNRSTNFPPSQSSSRLPISLNSGDSEGNSFVNEENIPPVFVSSNHPSSPAGAIDSIASDGSKESTKSSGSHSLMNGLTNGHAPPPSMQHRTPLC